MCDVEQGVKTHYSSFGQRAPILAALAKRGISTVGVTPAQLAPYDQFHTGGAVATQRLSDLLAPRPNDRILDLGSGLGGPARMLSDIKGCEVTGIDLAPHFVEAAAYFSGLTGQSERVRFQQGSATALPFSDATFDGAWQLHVSMNVAEKDVMYTEVSRALKSGSHFVIHDPVRGASGAVTFPVPWASEPGLSFLWSREEILSCLESKSFEIVDAYDATAEGLAWFDEMDAARKKPAAQESKSNVSQVPNSLEVMTKNHRANLESGAVKILTVVGRKRA
jgi:SAM-dependent methyltransferase